MNLPNTLTILRIFFVPFLVAVLVEQNLRIEWRGAVLVSNAFLALAIFLIAAATDLLDGYLARRWKQITTVGTLLDPIADKLLISAALISLVQIRRVPAWMVVLIIGREFAVSGLRSIAAAEGYTIQASDLGKTKMITQVVAISMILASIRWEALSGFALLWMWGVVIFGIASAVQYFRKFWRMVDDSIKHRRRQQLLRIERQRKRMLRQQAQGAGKEKRRSGAVNRVVQSLSLGGEKIWKLSGVNSTINTCPRAPSGASNFPFNRTSRPAALPTRILADSLPPTVLLWFGCRIPEKTGLPSEDTDTQVASCASRSSVTLLPGGAGSNAGVSDAAAFTYRATGGRAVNGRSIRF